MKIVLGIPVYNNVEFLKYTVDSMLSVGFDDIVYLDDGSTDGTSELLQSYSDKYENIHVIKNDSNSVLTQGVNRWKILAEHCKSFNPDWIIIRAADQVFSAMTKALLRPRLEYLLNTGVNAIGFPVAHFWRSRDWYRTDGEWGHSAEAHFPNHFEGKVVKSNINVGPLDNGVLPIVVLHYGMSSHDLIDSKLDFQMKMSDLVEVNGVPRTNVMPHPKSWNRYNGYKIAHEHGAILTMAPQEWFDAPINHEPKPRPRINSMYETIAKYNKSMALEYRKIYDKKSG